ncbi:AMP-dependent synthetase and ligase [Tolypothrix sp. NIES-4075]|uniref:class I adenylate-forming enzyme family protein n=1 Tax=Tolypothrix sp. NIES-4075 TaxID=2005459 RepID=UPI000B5C28B2|nr:long-chain fatty acid--CoA ligase [Tolypothrix sp. NIES-4075]GAX45610.1 AMP-dependent synthetase and ligase [Tolypothrix sp. NIES-4075]
MNIAHNIERGRQFFPNKKALIFDEKSFTYKELDEMVNRVANTLSGLGIERGQRVAIFLPNTPEFVISYLGILKIGAIAVSLNVMLKKSEVKFILNDCCAKGLITTDSLSENVLDSELPELKHILIAVGEARKGMSLEQLLSCASPNARAIEMERDEPAAIVYTSGTTGFPKGATLSHGNVISNIYSKNRCCRMQPEDRLLLYVPLFHCFGQNAILNAGLNACATIILQRRFELEQVLKSITTHGVTMFFGVPTVFIRLLDTDMSGFDLDSVRYYFTAAAPMPMEIVQRWHSKHGYVIHEGYGLTETSPFACYNHDLRYKLGSIGTPIENVEMKIVNVDGESVQPGEVGEIVVRGPNVMLGYWNRPLETAQVIKNGWFHTGDIGRMDEDGYFYIVDRLKDMINVSGFKVYPTEVENVIYLHPAVAECAVYGVPDPVKGEIVKANILLKPGEAITKEQIIAFCSEKMAAYKIPHTVEFIDSLPKNGTGKVLKKLLREEAKQGFRSTKITPR